MLLSTGDVAQVSEFYKTIEPFRSAYQIYFSFLAIPRDNLYVLHQGRIFLQPVHGSADRPSVKTSEVWCATYFLDELGLSLEELVERLLSGAIDLPDGRLVFVGGQDGTLDATFFPLNPEDPENQTRVCVLRVLGANISEAIHVPTINWSLRGSARPYNTLGEVLVEHTLGGLISENSTIDIVAFNVIAVDLQSDFDGEDAYPSVIISKRIDRSSASLGYVEYDKGMAPLSRGVLSADQMEWAERDSDTATGKGRLKVRRGSVLHCIARLDNLAIHHGWISDRRVSQNPRRVMYNIVDNKLSVLSDFLKLRGRGNNARHFEDAVAWLVWVLGFNVTHFNGTNLLSEAVDLIAATPSGNFAVLECTIGTLKAENKLASLVHRATMHRNALAQSGHGHLKVLPVIVTSLTAEEVRTDLEQARSLGVVVITAETLERWVFQSEFAPNPERLFTEAEEALGAPQDSGGLSG